MWRAVVMATNSACKVGELRIVADVEPPDVDVDPVDEDLGWTSSVRRRRGWRTGEEEMLRQLTP